MYQLYINHQFLASYFLNNNLETICLKNQTISIENIDRLQKMIENYEDEKKLNEIIQNEFSLPQNILEHILFYLSNKNEKMIIYFQSDFTLEDKDKISLWLGLKNQEKMIFFVKEKTMIENILQQHQEKYSLENDDNHIMQNEISWDFLENHKDFIQLIDKNYDNQNFLKKIQWNKIFIESIAKELSSTKLATIIDLLSWTILLEQGWIDWGFEQKNIDILKKSLKVYHIYQKYKHQDSGYLNFLKEKEIPIGVTSTNQHLQEKEIYFFKIIEKKLLKDKKVLEFFLEKNYFYLFSLFDEKITINIDVFKKLYEQIQNSSNDQMIGINLLNFYSLKKIEYLFQNVQYREIYLQYLEKINNITPLPKETIKIFIKEMEKDEMYFESHFYRLLSILEYKKNSLGNDVIYIWNLFSSKIKKTEKIILRFIEVNPKIYMHLDKKIQQNILFFEKYIQEQDIYEKSHWEKIDMNILNNLEEESMISVIQKFPFVFLLEKFPLKWKKNEKVIIHTALLGEKNITYLQRFFQDEEKIIFLIKKNYFIYKLIPYGKKLNINIVKNYLLSIPEFNQGNLSYIPQMIFQNKDLWVSLLENINSYFKKENFNYFPKELWSYTPFVLKLADLIDQKIIEKNVLNNEPKILNVLESKKLKEGSVKSFLISFFLHQNIQEKNDYKKQIKI